jgi:hypothetical protein
LNVHNYIAAAAAEILNNFLRQRRQVAAEKISQNFHPSATAVAEFVWKKSAAMAAQPLGLHIYIHFMMRQ